MTKSQAKFYEHWKNEWKKGNSIDIEENISYLFCYLYEVLSTKNYHEIILELSRVRDAYPQHDKISLYCNYWISDCHVCLGFLNEALASFPKIPLGGRASSMTDVLLSLKLHAGKDIEGYDVLTLLGPKVTAFAKKNLEEISEFINVQISAEKINSEKNFLDSWRDSTYKHRYSVFTGSVHSTHLENLHGYSFSLNPNVHTFVLEMSREAENTYREEKGFPKVGEGWISETALYYKIKAEFPKNIVTHHARPEWLGRQHLDVFIEDLSIALEYQGLQHDQPVEFFGGVDAYKSNLRRDKKKKTLCSKNGINLIYVREGYIFEDIVRQIRKNIKS